MLAANASFFECVQEPGEVLLLGLLASSLCTPAPPLYARFADGESVALFLKRPCDRTLGALRADGLASRRAQPREQVLYDTRRSHSVYHSDEARTEIWRKRLFRLHPRL